MAVGAGLSAGRRAPRLTLSPLAGVRLGYPRVVREAIVDMPDVVAGADHDMGRAVAALVRFAPCCALVRPPSAGCALPTPRLL